MYNDPFNPSYAPAYQGNPAGIVLRGEEGFANAIGQGISQFGAGFAHALAARGEREDKANQFKAMMDYLDQFNRRPPRDPQPVPQTPWSPAGDGSTGLPQSGSYGGGGLWDSYRNDKPPY